MISDRDIADLLASTPSDAPTPGRIRSLVLKTVDTALCRHYGVSAAIKCYQSSLAISRLLNRYGVEAQVWTGDVCVAEDFDRWGGYWGDDPHVWVMTKREELVDLTINRLHQRPIAQQRPGPPVPAIWWFGEHWPRCIRYLPEGRATHDFELDEQDDLDHFLAVCDEIEQDLRKRSRLRQMQFGPIIRSIDDLNHLLSAGNRWAEVGAFFDTQAIPYPPDIATKLHALSSRHPE